MADFTKLKAGDKVVRMLGGEVPMPLTVTEVSPELITCGDWTFDPYTGAEIDDVMRWGPKYGITGSYLKLMQ